jgi:V-type H+-transporting ATPase subunit a
VTNIAENALVLLEDIHALAANDLTLDLNKSIYVVLFQEGEALKARVAKVCDSFGAERFEVPDNVEEKLKPLLKEIDEADRLLKMTRAEIKQALQDIASPLPGTKVSRLVYQMWYLTKEKALYHKMNMLRRENQLVRAICWCPVESVSQVAVLLTRLQTDRHGLVAKFMKLDDHGLVPPTYLPVNDFTWAYQEIVSTYGTPSYREVNPAFFTIVTFPFLFGVMFGDACHGLCLLAFAIYLCWAKDKLLAEKSILAPLLKARYLFLLMGVFSTFCGLIYNDFGGLNLNVFSTCFYARWAKNVPVLEVHKHESCVYPIGVDPFWKYSTKQLQFENSFKMKLAVILGVLQMALGVFLKLANAIEFRRKYDIYFEFIPQIVFLIALFGYMDFLIFAKWMTNHTDTATAPFIITAVINMFLKFGGGDEKSIVSGQQTISLILVLLIYACVPLMLLPKPLLLRAEHERKARLAIAQDA